MPLYENVIIARQDISAQQVEALTESLQGIVQDNGGTVERIEQWGLRNLAYRIKKNRKGHYFMMNIDASAETMRELERNVRINEDVIRYMSIRVEAFEEGPSAMLQSRSSRDGGRRDRDGRGHRSERFDRGGRTEKREPSRPEGEA